MHKLGMFMAASIAITAPSASLAHHSAAMFDHTRVLSAAGTIKSFTFQAPHAWLSIVGAGGRGKQWDFELGSPGQLTRLGIERNSWKPGDRVTVAFFPLHDGRPAGAFLYLTDSAGKLYGVKADKLPSPTPVSN